MPASPPVIEYFVRANHRIVAAFDHIDDAKEAAYEYAMKTGFVADVIKSTTQRFFTYTPQEAPPPVES